MQVVIGLEMGNSLEPIGKKRFQKTMDLCFIAPILKLAKEDLVHLLLPQQFVPKI
jgi:hypothetical protein